MEDRNRRPNLIMSLLNEIISKCPKALVDAGQHGEIAALVSVDRVRSDGITKFSSLGISERFPALGGLPGPLAAELVFQKLEGFAAAAIAGSDPAGKLLGGAILRQMKHLEGSGMAIGSPAVAAMLAAIVAQGGLTQDEAAALSGIALVDDPVSVQAVIAAMEGL